MKKKAFFLCACTLVLIAALALLLPGRRVQLPPPSDALLAAAQGLDGIVIEAELDADARAVRVKQQLTLTNRTGQEQRAAVLRTWPNAFQRMDTSPCAVEDALYSRFYPSGFSLGALVMSRAQADGQTVVYRYTDDARTVLSVPVPGAWQVDETVVLSLEYTIQLPRTAYRFGVWDDIWALGNAFVIPAVWQDGAFRTDAYAPVGDPFVSECANYTVTVSVPDGYVCAGSGVPSTQKADGRTVCRFESPAVRDFALVVSSRFRTAQAMEGDTLVCAYALDGARAGEMLRYARKAIACYEALYGPYPYQSFTVAQTGLPLGGMEYPQLAMIGTDYVDAGGRELEYAVAHEAAHQWWYAVVGSDGWYQPWQDEALCEWSLLQYAERTYGPGERADLESSRAMSAMRVTVPEGVTPGAPLDTFDSMGQYKLVVYDRGCACFIALDELLPDGLTPFLRDYYRRYAFTIASRADFETQIALSTGEDLAPLMRDYLDTNILN